MIDRVLQFHLRPHKKPNWPLQRQRHSLRARGKPRILTPDGPINPKQPRPKIETRSPKRKQEKSKRKIPKAQKTSWLRAKISMPTLLKKSKSLSLK